MELIYNGYVPDLTNEQYHSAPGLSKSQLDDLAVSPRQFWYNHIAKLRDRSERKNYFVFGDGTHKLVLEPHEFERTYFVGFDKSAHPDALDTAADMKAELSKLREPVSGTKPELAARLVEAGFPRDRIMIYLEATHNASAAGRIELPADDYKHIRNMLQAIAEHHTAPGLIQNAFVEQSYFWTDDNNVTRKCRPDIITADGRIMVDLKTTDDVSETGFGRKIINYRYHVQAAWYLDILRELYGTDAPKYFAFIAAQKSAPYDVAVHVMTDDQIEIGRQIYQRDLAVYQQCQQLNYWPGADGGQVLEVKFPAWAYTSY